MEIDFCPRWVLTKLRMPEPSQHHVALLVSTLPALALLPLASRTAAGDAAWGSSPAPFRPLLSRENQQLAVGGEHFSHRILKIPSRPVSTAGVRPPPTLAGFSPLAVDGTRSYFRRTAKECAANKLIFESRLGTSA
jgi:hypothetical protein